MKIDSLRLTFILEAFVFTATIITGIYTYINTSNLEYLFLAIVISLLIVAYSINKSYKLSLTNTSLKMFLPVGNDRILIVSRIFFVPIVFYTISILTIFLLKIHLVICAIALFIITFLILTNIYNLFQKYSTEEIYEIFLFDLLKIISMIAIGVILFYEKKQSLGAILALVFFFVSYIIFLLSFKKIYTPLKLWNLISVGLLALINSFFFYLLNEADDSYSILSLGLFATTGTLVSVIVMNMTLKQGKIKLVNLLLLSSFYFLVLIFTLQT